MTPLKLHLCKFCGRRYTYRDTLMHHMRKKHWKQFGREKAEQAKLKDREKKRETWQRWRSERYQKLSRDVVNAALDWYRQLISFTPGHPLQRACAALEKFETGEAKAGRYHKLPGVRS